MNLIVMRHSLILRDEASQPPEKRIEFLVAKNFAKNDFKNRAKPPIFSKRIKLARIQNFRLGRYVLFLHVSRLNPKIGGCFRTAEGAQDFCRIRGYLSTARKQGHRLLIALQRVLKGKPLIFNSAKT
jgi:hypothetical protein